MRLFVITNSLDRASFRQRIGVHVPLLEKRGIRCEVVALPTRPWDRARLCRRSAAFDAVFLQRKTLNPWEAFWLRRYGPKLIYDFDDAVMYSDRRSEKPCRGRQRRFRRTIAASDAIIAGNSYLAAHARYGSSTVHVVPTGLDLGPYAVEPPVRQDGRRRLVWIGSRSTLKHLAGVTDVLEEVGRRNRDVVLRIVCDTFFDLKHMEVEKVPWSLDTEAMSLLTSDIGLAPLPDNPFTRGKCGFKILQYQAAGLPVVASPVGVNAQYVRPRVTGYHASTPAAWLESLECLLADARQRQSMGRQARADVQPFALETIAGRLCEIITACIDAGDSTRRS